MALSSLLPSLYGYLSLQLITNFRSEKLIRRHRKGHHDGRREAEGPGSKDNHIL